MLDSVDIQGLLTDYVIPWSINIGLALAIFIVGRLVAGVVTRFAARLLEKAGTDKMLVGFVSSILNAVLLLFVVIASLDKLGVDTTSFIALIGAAGLAVGLALQGSMQNFASGVLLIIFHPFKVGDFIEAGGTAGVVEQIGIFSTTMKTGDNRIVIVPNGAIYGGNITNNSAREHRRIDLIFGIGYGDDIKKTKEILQSILAADERILEEPEATVVVGELADSSVNFYVRPWVKSSDFWTVRCDITEKVKLAFDEAGISIPFPQMDVHINNPEKA
ncbi:MAG TPA: mechanosensitive ion channel domain-containing protein [Mariprofundaceae bacterium]|nr:mechanosensitive ion channel domain-containing protein [Mariprofundaceae bacterium]